jgi:hypothetical protein
VTGFGPVTSCPFEEERATGERCWAYFAWIGCLACFAGEAAPQAPGSWVPAAEMCVASLYDCALPGETTSRDAWCINMLTLCA